MKAWNTDSIDLENDKCLFKIEAQDTRIHMWDQVKQKQSNEDFM